MTDKTTDQIGTEWEPILKRSTLDGALNALILDNVGTKKHIENLSQFGVKEEDIKRTIEAHNVFRAAFVDTLLRPYHSSEEDDRT